MTPERLAELAAAGWRITRDGSTATAAFAWEDPAEPGDGWEAVVKHTSGHGARWSIDSSGLGLSERSLAELRLLERVLSEVRELVEGWDGTVPVER